MANPGDWFGSHFYVAPADKELFNQGETSLDLFLMHYNHDIRDGHRSLSGTLGGGIGGSYFFTRELGVELDTSISDNGDSFFDYLAGNAIYRFPIPSLRLAPYVMGGFAGQFDLHEDASGDIGAGLEYRLNPITSAFFDARYFLEWGDTQDYWLFRWGIKFGF